MSTASASDGQAIEAPIRTSKPAFLRRVRIRGYKSIAFCDVALEPLTILVGRNASGKSNFLDALGFLRDTVKFGVNEAVGRHGGAGAILCRSSGERVVSIEIECEYSVGDEADPWRATYRIDFEFPKSRPAKICREELRIEQGGWWMGYANESGRVTYESADDPPQQWTWKVRERPFLDFYRDTPVPEFLECLEAIATYNFNPESIRQLHQPDPGTMLARDGRNIASLIESVRAINASTVTRVGKYLTAIVQEVERFEVVRYGEYETVRFRLRSGEPGRASDFDAASMSDGTLRALAALMAAFQSHRPFGPVVVAIEEPETALHPAAMRALVAALDEATLRTQILLTTHSPDLLDAGEIEPENVRVVQMVDGRTVIGPVDEASVSIVRDHLSTLGALERERQLEPDPDDLDRQTALARREATPP